MATRIAILNLTAAAPNHSATSPTGSVANDSVIQVVDITGVDWTNNFSTPITSGGFSVVLSGPIPIGTYFFLLERG